MLKKQSSSGKRVSFILPTRNRPDFVDQTLKAAQKYVTANDELIVVDGSQDDLTEVVVKKYSKVVTKYIRTTDIGEGHKMNVGILNSAGQIIKPISDDDVIYPVALKKAISVLEKDDQIDALQCGGEAYRYDKNTKQSEFLFYEKVPAKVLIGSDYNQLLTYVPCHLGLIFKRRVLPVLGLYDTTFSGTDINLMARLIKSKLNFKYLDVCLYRHIQYEHSTELYAAVMNRDRARVFLVINNWSGALTVDTKALADGLGLSPTAANQGYIWVIKILNYMREKRIGQAIFSVLGFVIEQGRNVYISFKPLTPLPFGTKKVRWTGQYW